MKLGLLRFSRYRNTKEESDEDGSKERKGKALDLEGMPGDNATIPGEEESQDSVEEEEGDDEDMVVVDMSKADLMKMMAKAKESLMEMMANGDLTEDDFAMENESLEDPLVDEQLDGDAASSDELNDGYKLVMDIIIEEVLEDDDDE